MQKGQVRCRELHSKCPKGDARWGMFAETSGQSITWGHRRRSVPKLWRATPNLCISSQDISFLLLLQCPLYLHRGCSHGRAFAEPGLAWIFNGVNNHRSQCCAAVWLPGSRSVTGSQRCPLSPCPALLAQPPGANCTHTHGLPSFCPFDVSLSQLHSPRCLVLQHRRTVNKVVKERQEIPGPEKLASWSDLFLTCEQTTWLVQEGL